MLSGRVLVVDDDDRGHPPARGIREGSHVAVTAKAMKGDRERCLEAGATGYVSKPVDPLELVGLVVSLIDRGGAAPGAAAVGMGRGEV